MRVLVPFDGSPASERALRFAAGFAGNYGADLHPLHLTDDETVMDDGVAERAAEILSAAGPGTAYDPEIVEHEDLSGRAAEKHVGEHVVDIVGERGFDHVVMGRHGGSGRLQQLIEGSATKEVVTGADVPVTVVP